jgi:hypothetical protein
MARAATTTDVFNAIAEPRRREIIGILSNGEEWAVNNVVANVDIEQPAVSRDRWSSPQGWCGQCHEKGAAQNVPIRCGSAKASPRLGEIV